MNRSLFFLIILIVSVSLKAKSVKIKNRKTGEIISITSEKGLCVSDDVIICHFAKATLTHKKNKQEIIKIEDKTSIYFVADALSRSLCEGAYNCKYEIPYSKTGKVIKDFKGAAIIQAPFFIISDTIRLPYLIGKGILQMIKNKMAKGRKIIRSIDPLKKDKSRIKQVVFSDKNFAQILRTIESVN